MLKKIIQWIKKNKLWAVWALAVIVVSSLLVWAIIGSNRSQPTPVTLIELPLNTETVHQVNVRNEIVSNSDFPQSLEVFPIIQRNYSSVVESMLQKLNKSTMSRFSSQGAVYMWTQGDDYVEYIPNLQTLYFRFPNAADPRIDIRVTDPQGGKSYIEQLYKQLLDREYEFMNVTAVSQGLGRTRIEGNRVVNGLALNTSTYDGYSDFLVIDGNGDLVEGRLLLIEPDMQKGDSIRLVHISNLQSAMRTQSYPKTVIQGPNQILTEIIDGSELIEEEDGVLHAHVDFSSTDFPVAVNSTAENVELVYLYFDSGSTHLSPVYKLKGQGQVIYEGNRINMPIIVYANALDPDRVYIPN